MQSNEFKIEEIEFKSVVQILKAEEILKFGGYDISLDEFQKLRFKKEGYTLFLVGKMSVLNSDLSKLQLISLAKNKSTKTSKNYQNVWNDLVKKYVRQS